MPSTVQRSRSTPSTLPWASLSRVSNSPVQSPNEPQSPSVGTPTSPFAQSKVSAFRSLSGSSETAKPVLCGELPRGLQPHQLNPSKMRCFFKRCILLFCLNVTYICSAKVLVKIGFVLRLTVFSLLLHGFVSLWQPLHCIFAAVRITSSHKFDLTDRGSRIR